MKRGFTLIETIIYIALFSILMGAATITAWALFQSNSRAHTISIVQEEGDYLIGKIQWALYGSKAVTTPPASATGGTLTTVEWDTALGNPIQFCLSGTNMNMATTSGASCPVDGIRLNNDDVQVSNLMFVHATSSGDGINPESVHSSFTISGILPNGERVNRGFSSINYIRQ